MELLLLLLPAAALVALLSVVAFFHFSLASQRAAHSGRDRLSARIIQDFVRALAVAENRIYRNNLALKTSAARLSAANEELASLNEMKSKFLSMVVHDVRTPLAAIRGFAQLFGMQKEATEKQKKMSGQMTAAVDRLGRLVADLTDLAMIEAGKLTIEASDFRLGQMLDELLPSIEINAANKGVLFRYDEVPADETLRADKFRLSQVLQNLLNNAIKFTPEGGLVELGGRSDGRWLTLKVRDSGIGIHPSETKKIFEKLYQAKYQKDEKLRKQGWGLGLSIAHEIITRHGGRIWAESPGLGKGAIFCFKVPVRPIAPETFI